MKHIKPTDNEQQWPRTAVTSVETRKRDLVIRIADWTRQKDGEPAFDVECYIGGVYDYHQGESCTVREHGTRKAAKAAAITFAQNKIAKLL